MKKVLIVGILIAIFFATFVFAQTTTQPLAPDLSLSSNPINPGPGESTVITAQSYSVDLDQAMFYWKYNGIAIAQGIGVRKVTIKAPAAGQVGSVTATINAAGAPQATADITLRPASVDVLWEAVNAYTPPFYKGKALPPVAGPIKAVAIPAANAPKQATYRWSENDSALQEQSGYNQSSIIVIPDALTQTERFSVTVEAGSFQGAGNTSVSTRAPSIIAYLKSEGFTDYAHGFTSAISARGTGTTVRFEPYYFSAPNSINSNLSFITKVDGNTSIGDPINELRFSRPSDTTATAGISVNIASAFYPLQSATRSFNLSFE